MKLGNARRAGPLTRWQSVTSSLLLAAVAACSSQPGVTNSVSYAPSASRPSSYNPPGSPGDPWGPYIREASRRFDVPERWIREVMRQESAGRATATSPVGAMGLMQVMPGTYTELRYKHGLGDDPYHPYDSIMAGTAYIRQMYDLYGSPAFLAAYNAGPRRLEDYLWSGRSMPNETRNYVARIGPRIVDAHPTRRAAPEVYAAAEIPLNVPPGPRRADPGIMLALREQREQRRSADSIVQVATLPAGPVVRMEPIPDGSTYPDVQVASLSGTVVRMDPIPDGSTYPTLSEPADRVVRMDPIPNPPEAPVREPVLALSRPSAPARVEPFTLALPTPPVLPTRQMARAQLPTTAGPRGFGFIGSAQAGILPGGPRTSVAASVGGAWAVQVGAFASENLARVAADQARDRIATTGARVAVQPVIQGQGGRLYRARIVGLSRDVAQTACDRLRARGACMALSPDAQG